MTRKDCRHTLPPQSRWIRLDLGRRLRRSPLNRPSARFLGWFPLISSVSWRVELRSWNVLIVPRHAPSNHMGGPALQVSRQTQNDYSQYRTTMGTGRNCLSHLRRFDWHTSRQYATSRAKLERRLPCLDMTRSKKSPI